LIAAASGRLRVSVYFEARKMRVKLFLKDDPLGPRRWQSAQQHNALDFENEMNEWLKMNPNVKIVEIKQTASGGSFGAPLWWISVWYEESSPS
jgi:hypothetical protein